MVPQLMMCHSATSSTVSDPEYHWHFGGLLFTMMPYYDRLIILSNKIIAEKPQKLPTAADVNYC